MNAGDVIFVWGLVALVIIVCQGAKIERLEKVVREFDKRARTRPRSVK